MVTGARMQGCRGESLLNWEYSSKRYSLPPWQGPQEMVTPKSIGNAGIAATDGGERRRNGGLEKIQYVQPQGPPDGCVP